MSQRYNEFMEQYKAEHRCCPKCGDTVHSITLAGFIFIWEERHNYKDLNRCVCAKCGDTHVRHDRVPEIAEK